MDRDPPCGEAREGAQVSSRGEGGVVSPTVFRKVRVSLMHFSSV
jgi:hypothetical protein